MLDCSLILYSIVLNDYNLMDDISTIETTENHYIALKSENDHLINSTNDEPLEETHFNNEFSLVSFNPSLIKVISILSLVSPLTDLTLKIIPDTLMSTRDIKNVMVKIMILLILLSNLMILYFVSSYNYKVVLYFINNIYLLIVVSFKFLSKEVLNTI